MCSVGVSAVSVSVFLSSLSQMKILDVYDVSVPSMKTKLNPCIFLATISF